MAGLLSVGARFRAVSSRSTAVVPVMDLPFTSAVVPAEPRGGQQWCWGCFKGPWGFAVI